MPRANSAFSSLNPIVSLCLSTARSLFCISSSLFPTDIRSRRSVTWSLRNCWSLGVSLSTRSLCLPSLTSDLLRRRLHVRICHLAQLRSPQCWVARLSHLIQLSHTLRQHLDSADGLTDSRHFLLSLHHRRHRLADSLRPHLRASPVLYPLLHRVHCSLLVPFFLFVCLSPSLHLHGRVQFLSLFSLSLTQMFSFASVRAWNASSATDSIPTNTKRVRRTTESRVDSECISAHASFASSSLRDWDAFCSSMSFCRGVASAETTWRTF